MLTFKDLLITGPEALCLTDTEMRIIEHNQIMNILLGLNNDDLCGKHLSNILYDDMIIQHITKTYKQDNWFHGECLLKTRFKAPLLVKLRTGQVIDDNTQQKVYVFIFTKIDELPHPTYSRRINALKSLLNSILIPDMKPEDILIEFIRAYDQHATASLLDPNLYSGDSYNKDYHFLPLKQAFETAQTAVCNKTSMFYQDESLWCFFPIYSERETYGVACVKFSVPHSYDDEDKMLFTLCGRMLGSYIERRTIAGQSNHPDSMLQIAFDNIRQPIIAVNKKGLIIRINNAVKAVYGFTGLEMLGKSFGDTVFLPDALIQYDDLLNIVIGGIPIYDKKTTHVRSDLTTVDVSISAYPCKSEDGTVIGAIFIMQDIGQQSRIKSKITQLEKLSALGELLYSAANELNNSLTSVIGHSELLVNMKDEIISNIASKVYKGSLRCGSVVSGLLNLARENETQEDYSSIDELMKLALDLKHYQWRSNNIHLHMKVDKNIPQVAANPRDIMRLILHIIDDAERRILEYEDGGRLSIEVRFDNGSVIFCFTDTGTCILKRNMDEIYSCLYDPSVSDEYTDVGLVTSCRILEKIGGSIHIDSQIGKDNTITIEIPTVEGIPSTVAEYENELAIYKNGKNILLVDDEVDIVELLMDYLQMQGYIVDIAGDGSEAFEKVLMKDYDVIISDLKMPNGFTGDRLHGFVKRKNPALAQRMVFMTGDIINSETQKFLQSTNNQYIEKPFLPESLMEIIGRISA